MDVRDAIARAKTYIGEVFADQRASDLRLEEVEFDEPHDRWNVTISFLRGSGESPSTFLEEIARRQRTYRSVAVAADSGKMISIKSRDVVE